MVIRLGKHILTAVSLIITLIVSLLAYNISNQVKDGIVGSYKYYDTILGPSGSQTQLVLNTLFYTDKPLGLIGYDEYEKIAGDSRVAVAIPFAEGDNYNNARIIGTEAKYLDEFTISQGAAFDGEYEAVIGFNIAKSKGLKLGDTFYSVHGLTTDVNSHSHTGENEQYTVAGILAKTNTATDNVIFTDINSVWESHGLGHDDHDDDDCDDEHGEKGVTAVLIRCTSLSAQMSLAGEYNKTAGMQAVNPSVVMRALMNNVDVTKNIVYVLCAVILTMNLFIISVITMLNMYDVKKDVELLRLIGVSKGRIEAVVYVQNLIMLCVSILFGLGISRFLMAVVDTVTRSMGIVLDTAKFYGLEAAIASGIVLTAFLPVFIAVKKIFAGRIIDEK